MTRDAARAYVKALGRGRTAAGTAALGRVGRAEALEATDALIRAALLVPLSEERRRNSGLVEQHRTFHQKPSWNPLFEAGAEIQAFFVERGWQNTVIGGLAVQRWGEPRQTRDVDLALLTGIGHEHEYTDTILARFQARRPDARAGRL